MVSGFAGGSGAHCRARRVGAVGAAILIALALAPLAVPGHIAVAKDDSVCPWMNAHQSSDAWARELLAAMTLEQKMRGSMNRRRTTHPRRPSAE